jgi:hypothetical protein
MPFRDSTGKIGVTVPSGMTIEDAVRLGIEIKMVPKDRPWRSDTYRYDYERDMPPERRNKE